MSCPILQESVKMMEIILIRSSCCWIMLVSTFSFYLLISNISMSVRTTPLFREIWSAWSIIIMRTAIGTSTK